MVSAPAFRFALALLLATCSVAACSGPQVQPDEHLGQQLAITVQDLRTSQPIDSSSWLGHVVLVDLWASWCVSCKQAMPHHAELWNRLHSRGFDVIAISVDEDQAAAEQFLRDNPLPFAVAWDAGQHTANALKPREMPTAYVLDRQGKVVAVAGGGTLEAMRAIDEAVEAALGPP